MKNMKKVFYFEFYNKTTGFLEHNDEYETVEDAFKDAKGRIVICTGYVIENDKFNC